VDTAPAEAETTTSASNVDLSTPVESYKVVELEQTRPPSVGGEEMVEFAAAAAIPDDPFAVDVITVSTQVSPRLS